MLLIYVLVGSIAGLHSSCWGGYKDSPYEPFIIKKYIRSIIVGAVFGLIMPFLLKIHGYKEINLALFFVFVIALERVFTETLKAFFREENQEKYNIPTKFHYLGKIVDGKILRIFLGIGFLGLIYAMFCIPEIYGNFIRIHLLTCIFWGAMSGLASSLGGMWKDAPIEGFDIVKFPRSFIFGGIWGGILSPLVTGEYSLLFFACIGSERMVVECYKTFFMGGPSSKFKIKEPVCPDWVEKRKVLLTPYIITWITFLGLLIPSLIKKIF
ncbi:MAG: hypothetical protein ABRQ39_00550 [Candidatus Eremiobacterota bacterium]